MLGIDLKGKKAFVAGVGDDQGYGWAIAKALATAGAEIYLGVWPPVLRIFRMAFDAGKFDESRQLPDGSMMEIKGIFPLDAAFDTPEEVPADISENKRYAGLDCFTISEAADSFAAKHGKVDILVHALANGPEVKNPLLETSRGGYLAALSASAYSFVSLIRYFGPHCNANSTALSLTYLAAERTVPKYGGGMSSAKAALESDTRTLAFEAGRKWGMRVNTISAGPLRSRAARAIGMIEDMIDYAKANSPIQRDLSARDVGETGAFLLSPLSRAITGSTVYVDNGYHTMGCATQAP